MNHKLSRRSILHLIGTGAAASSVLSVTNGLAIAQSRSNRSFHAIYKFSIGDWDMMVIKDTGFTLDAAIFGVNQPSDDVYAFFDNLGILNADKSLNALTDILVAQKNEHIVLFDTGMGVTNGVALLESLAFVGIQPEDVTHVIMSHWHPDHINGLSHGGVLTFPKALVMFPQSEYEFMQNLPDVTAGAMIKLQPAIDADQIQFYSDGAILSDITAISTPGHTPGHMSFVINSKGDQLINMVDSVLNVYSHTAHPNWHAQFDADGDLATVTRINMMNRVADEKSLVFGYHFPFPGLGQIVKETDTFRFHPVSP